MHRLLFAAVFLPVLFLTSVGHTIEPGKYISHELKLKDIEVERFGNGVKINTCAEFDDGGCQPINAVLYPSGTLWSGRGDFHVSYGQGEHQCRYDVEFHILYANDELKVDYFGPSFLPGLSHGCPSVATVASTWYALETPFTAEAPCLPDPIFQLSQCH